MSTVDSVVTRALREISVLAAGEPANGDDMTDGIDSLNEMLAAWELDGIKLNAVTLNSGETLPYPDHHTDPIMYNLALRLCGIYEVTPKQTTVAFASNGYRNLQNYYVAPPDVPLPTTVRPEWEPNRYFLP